MGKLLVYDNKCFSTVYLTDCFTTIMEKEMTEREKQRFQLKTMIGNSIVTLIISLSMAAWGYSRSDSKELQAKVDQKVEKTEFKDYKQEVATQFNTVKLDNNEKWNQMDTKITTIYNYLLTKDKKWYAFSYRRIYS